MAVPIRSVKHVQTEYAKLQLITLICALIALLAFSLSALSGHQLNALLTSQTAGQASALASERSEGDARQGKINELQKQIVELQSLLANEQTAAKMLKERISALENKLSEARKSMLKPAVAPVPHSSETMSPPPGQDKPAPADEQAGSGSTPPDRVDQGSPELAKPQQQE